MIILQKNCERVSVGYIRVSTSEDRQKLGYEIQRSQLTEAGVTYLYAETLSGRKDDRPEFIKAVKQAKRLARQGKKVTFVVYKLDRLARKMATILTTLEDLQKAGVSFKCLSENVNTATASGTLMMQLLGMFSEFEVNTLRARTKEALRQAKLEGKLLGRPPVTEDIRVRILDLYQNDSITVETVARQCKVSARTVYRIAKASGISRRGQNFNDVK